MSGFPLLLDLTARRVLVVGGGAVAARRAARLAEAAAAVEVVAQEASPQLRALGIPITEREFVDRDVDGAWLVFACTDDPAVNEAVARSAEQRSVFCVRADHAAGGTARTPAVVEQDGITVAVTGGDDPGRSTALRDAIALALDVGDLPARPTRPPAHGSVALVGGGPGAPDLITVRGRRLVAAADVIVIDRLAPRGLLATLPGDVEVVDCGKSAHRHNLTQDEINAVLVDRAHAGKRVVRLKGGDPFVFGRGMEEIQALAEAGIACTVVPGISSSISVPGAAGIPVTHRGVAHEFTVVSGHVAPDDERSLVDWPSLAKLTGTLVILMGVDKIGRIAETLVAHGKSADTPVALIQEGTTAAQRRVDATLATVAETVRTKDVKPPAVIVIGEVVGVGSRTPA